MENVPMTRPDLALALHDTRNCHDSTFARLDGGGLLHCAYGRFSVSEDGGLTPGLGGTERVGAYTYSMYEEHPTRAEMTLSSKVEGGNNQKLKVLPLNWFYGGKEPADNPFLRRAYEPAKP